MKLTRMTIDPAICTGKPCIRGLRFPVARLLGLLAAGESREQILASYPYIGSEDIDEALRCTGASGASGAAHNAQIDSVKFLVGMPLRRDRLPVV